MNIGQAAKASGVSAKMIRYYEETGLVMPAQRSEKGYRVYSEKDVHTLRFVRRARDLGFTVDRIADLLALWRDTGRQSAEVKQMAIGHVAALRKKITDLEEMAATLEHLADCCAGDHRPDCPILSDIATGAHGPAKSAHRFGALSDKKS
ncbi:transcriptional regulator [Asticcacaulis sp. AC460]|uniref:Cu(I)-responsive transcriptional regulator n=1 Tax=Asticcacaulis sp. AC460 TaxID=1282360 RepID=UPI0003C3E0DE|nr:Cu(I)-responsive transcriptional regulator [Asticcacaulis sp. AC460]ESQ88041.1 transcriptional regulator [Asticcacaulis sp. AC460]